MKFDVMFYLPILIHKFPDSCLHEAIKMGIKDFQTFVENDETITRPAVKTVDLVKTAWNINNAGQVNTTKILVMFQRGYI